MARPYAQMSPFVLAQGEATAGGGGSGSSVGLPFKGALVKPAADQTAKNFVSATAVDFDAEVYDVGGWHDNSVNNSRLTVPAGVTKVRVTGGAALAAVIVNDHIQLRLQANGSGAVPGLARTHADVQSSAPSLSASSGIIEVVEGDYFEMLLDTATDTSITVTAAETWFAIQAVETLAPSTTPRGALVTEADDDAAVDYTSVIALTWDTDNYDTDDIHDVVSNTSRLTVPTGVTKVRIAGQLRFSDLTSGVWLEAHIQKNGSREFIGAASLLINADNLRSELNLSTPVIDVVAGDFFELFIEIETDTSVKRDASLSWFSMEIVEPALVVGGGTAPDLLHVRQETSGQGGTSTATTWTKRVLNTVMTNEITGASLASDQITLPAGTYEIHASAPILDAFRFQLRLRNTTDNATLVVGTSENMGGTDDISRGHVDGRFTIDGIKVLEFQYWVAFAQATNGLGIAVGSGETNVYAEVFITKIV